MRVHELWCHGCDGMALWGTQQMLSLKMGVTVRTVFNWRMRGRVHTRPLPSGRLELCICSACGKRDNGCQKCREIFRKKLEILAATHLRPHL